MMHLFYWDLLNEFLVHSKNCQCLHFTKKTELKPLEGLGSKSDARYVWLWVAKSKLPPSEPYYHNRKIDLSVVKK